ncbi:hypothetical protein [Sinomicrobium weinanense]|uniref:Uncharacterized protein n=1 Tax=Sinomicrobium weinanense TaxID=2842200 RepID=A0A926JRX6_9FLAO|nr:hypothetical protein [Sinomicrobium weinanense]MBC9796395.1 hypothetical protein [Sinomicrobium weinanense]MBU3122604.1 hypothetical protein [Sinomicrobium weinanense]
MKAYKERKIIRWIHIILSIPVIGLIYGPVYEIPRAVTAIRWVFFPVILISGFWMWYGQFLKRWIKKKYLKKRS